MSRPGGYALAVIAPLLLGAVGVLAEWASAPVAVLLVLRFGIAAAVVFPLLTRRSILAEFRRPGVLPWLLLASVLEAGGQLAFFVAVRQSGVAVAAFLMFTWPVLVALMAPRFGARTDKAVWPVLTLCFIGLLVTLAPGLLGGDVHWSGLGAMSALAAALLFAFYVLIVNRLTRSLTSVSVVFAVTALTALLLLPVALWQMWLLDYSITGRDVVAACLLGVVSTALALCLWVAALERVPLQRVSALGYIEPASAPLYALVLLGQVPALSTVVGGVLIVASGLALVYSGLRGWRPSPRVAGRLGVELDRNNSRQHE